MDHLLSHVACRMSHRMSHISCLMQHRRLYVPFIHAVSSVPRSIATADVPLITRTPVSACFCLVAFLARGTAGHCPHDEKTEEVNGVIAKWAAKVQKEDVEFPVPRRPRYRNAPILDESVWRI